MKSEYPKKMYHPNFSPAVLSAGIAMNGEHGRAERLPKISVRNPIEEAYFAAKGYLVGNVKQPDPTPLRHKDRENIRMRQAPEPEVPETYEYPKYVGTEIAKDAEHEAEILAKQRREAATIERIRESGERWATAKNEPLNIEIEPDELAEFRAWKAQKARGSTKHEPIKRRPLTEEQKQVLRERMAKAREARRRNTKEAMVDHVSREWLRAHEADVRMGENDIETARIGTIFGLTGNRRVIMVSEAGDAQGI